MLLDLSTYCATEAIAHDGQGRLRLCTSRGCQGAYRVYDTKCSLAAACCMQVAGAAACLLTPHSSAPTTLLGVSHVLCWDTLCSTLHVLGGADSYPTPTNWQTYERASIPTKIAVSCLKPTMPHVMTPPPGSSITPASMLSNVQACCAAGLPAPVCSAGWRS